MICIYLKKDYKYDEKFEMIIKMFVKEILAINASNKDAQVGNCIIINME